MESRGLGVDCSCSYNLPELQCCPLKKPFSHLQPSRHIRQPTYWKHLQQHRKERQWLHAADLSADYPRGDEEPPELSETFPRIRESNPYRYIFFQRRIAGIDEVSWQPRPLVSLLCFESRLNHVFPLYRISSGMSFWMSQEILHKINTMS